MDSTPSPTQPISINPSATKLPIKRKTPDFSSSSTPNPNPNPDPVRTLVPKLEVSCEYAYDDDGEEIDAGYQNPPPFKFHRIWTEPDEIRFLHGLLDCSKEGLVFPRDLHLFYARFSQTMSQPYTKSQLSEKLRRLRKKFRVISSRLDRGLAMSALSPHDRSLFELSKKLWHPEFESQSPFGKNLSNDCINNIENKKRSNVGNSDVSGSNLVGVRVSFSPILPMTMSSSQSHENCTGDSNDNDMDDNDDNDNNDDHIDGENGGIDDDRKMSEVKVDYDFGEPNEVVLGLGGGSGGDVGRVAAAKLVVEVFDKSLKEVNTALVREGLISPASSSMERKAVDFDRRWREQRAAELGVLARRLRLVLENSLPRQ